jgi:hypothetical protein
MDPILEIGTNDPLSFLDFFVPLAHNLEGSGGIVYDPVPVIDPQAREAVSPADHVLVSLRSVDDLCLVHQTMRDYIAGDSNRELTLENRTVECVDTRITVTAGNFPDEEALKYELFS